MYTSTIEGYFNNNRLNTFKEWLQFQSLPKEMFVELEMEEINYQNVDWNKGIAHEVKNYKQPKLYPDNAVKIIKVILP